MALIAECPPCQIGEHERHYRVIQHAPEGGVGGAICVCKGKCRDRTPEENWARLGMPDLRDYFKGVK